MGKMHEDRVFQELTGCLYENLREYPFTLALGNWTEEFGEVCVVS